MLECGPLISSAFAAESSADGVKAEIILPCWFFCADSFPEVVEALHLRTALGFDGPAYNRAFLAELVMLYPMLSTHRGISHSDPFYRNYGFSPSAFLTDRVLRPLSALIVLAEKFSWSTLFGRPPALKPR